MVAVNSALMWQELGEEARASDALTDALEGAPMLAGDPFWRGDPARNALMADAAEEASNRDPYVAFQIALALDNLEDARRYAAAAGVDEELAERVIRAWDDDGAVDDLYRLAAERPLSAAVEWAITVASRHGDEEALERLQALGGDHRGADRQQPGRAADDHRARAWSNHRG